MSELHNEWKRRDTRSIERMFCKMELAFAFAQLTMMRETVVGHYAARNGTWKIIATSPRGNREWRATMMTDQALRYAKAQSREPGMAGYTRAHVQTAKGGVLDAVMQVTTRALA